MDRLPFTQVTEPYWDDKPLFIMAGGTSITDFDVSQFRGEVRILGCNRSAFYFNADAMVSLDRHFPRMDKPKIEKFIAEGSEVYLALPPNEPTVNFIQGVNYLEKRRGDNSLSTRPYELFGTNTGFAALNLAYHKKAQVIYMFGYDMQNGRKATHCHGHYSWNSSKNNSNYLKRWCREFDKVGQQFRNAGIQVINVVGSPRSLIPESVFEQMPISEFQ